MKKFIFIALFIAVLSLVTCAFEFKVKVGQSCEGRAGSSAIAERIYNARSWLNIAQSGRDRAFVQCVGQAQYAAYRPVDITIFGLFITAGLLGFVAWKRYTMPAELKMSLEERSRINRDKILKNREGKHGKKDDSKDSGDDNSVGDGGGRPNDGGAKSKKVGR